MSLISVVIPIYNAEKHLEACLTSILDQSLSDIDVICVNDGSTDRSLEIVQTFANRDARIKIVTQENGGRASARNAGIAHATAPYIMFCDADDSYHPQMCEKLYKRITESCADLAACELQIVYHANEELKESDDNYYTLKFDDVSENIQDIVNVIDLSVCNKIFKNSLIKKYDIRFPTGYNYEDANFCWKYVSVTNKCAFLKEKLYRYNRHPGSIMNLTFAKNSLAIDHIIIANDVFEFLKQHGLFDRFKSAFADFYIASFYFTKRYIAKKDMPRFYLLNHKFIKNYENYYYPHKTFGDIEFSQQLKHSVKNFLRRK